MDEKFFKENGISHEIAKAVHDLGYTEMTPIQDAAIPLIMQGKDIIGQSQTGTGKTCAFAIPAIEVVKVDMKKVQVLILCPTRELAIQNCNEIRKLAKYKQGINSIAIYGGEPINRQIMEFKKRPSIVVGTPGRIMDHMRRKTLKLNNLKMVILDEADEMLNMGFIDDIETILAEAPEVRQTILFSATMPEQIRALTNKFQKDPELIKVQSEAMTVENVEQICVDVPRGIKTKALMGLLKRFKPTKSLIFCNTKRQTDALYELLTKDGFKVRALHGDMRQTVRTEVINLFKSSRIDILVATDVAARGIDVKDIDVVFNYDIPLDKEIYVHRIGRTARAGSKGKSVTLATGRNEIYQVNAIQRFVNSEIKFESFSEDGPMEAQEFIAPQPRPVFSSHKNRRRRR